MIKNKILNNVKPKIIIVAGGGIAGLTAAAYSAKNGFDAILMEKNKEIGGLVNTIEVDGFKFDTGLRALLNAGIILPMLEELGINLKILPSPVSIGIEKDIINIERKEDLLKYKNLLIKYYPESKKEIEKLIRIIYRIMKLVDILYKIENPIFKNPLKDKNYLFKKLIPWLPQFLFAVFSINKLYIPVEKYLDRFITNQSLKDIIYQHFFKNTPTFFALSYFSLYLNYFYPEGGTGSLVDSIEKKAKEFGVKFLKETRIEKVLVDENKVIDNNQKEYNYDYLVWAADLKYFYNIADVKKSKLKVKKSLGRKKDKIFNSKGNDSVYTLFLQLDIKPEEIKNISNGHFFYTPYKNGLGKLNKEDLENIINNFDKLNREYIFNWLSEYIKYNTFEISIPCLKDKSMSDDNKTGIILSILTDYQLFKNVEKSGWLDQFVAKIEN
ncbi:MAG: phytoene desaturase family protein, partial [Exilispira sp.]